METNFKPNYAIHPGAFLKEELSDLRLTQKSLSEKTGISRTIINEIISGKRNINADTAVKFESVLYSPARYWLNLQSLYDETQARLKLAEEEGKKFKFSANANLKLIVNDIVVKDATKYHSYSVHKRLEGVA